MIERPANGVFTSAMLAEYLAPTLGWEKGSEVVGGALAKLGQPGTSMTQEQALAVLDELGRAPGMVGIAARFARSRLEPPSMPRAPMPSSPDPPASGPGPVSSSGAAAGPVSARAPLSSRLAPGTTVTADDVASLLANAIGADKAHEVVLGAVQQLSLRADRLDKAQAMHVLDHLAAAAGVVGLCARFAKARLILRFAA